MMDAVFADRWEAGKKLAQKLTDYANHPQAIVLGLPRGGVPVAYEIAKHLNLPLDVCLVRKLGLPNSPETAMGAIAEDALFHNYSGNINSDNIMVIDADMIQQNGVEQSQIQAIAAKERAELRWRSNCYRHCRPMLLIRARTVILVDDGIATGSTMQAAITALGKHKPQQIIIAAPVASSQGASRLNAHVNNSIYLVTTQSLHSVGSWYKNFNQVTDQEVCNLLAQETHRNLADSC